jgi:hypothetical protein
MHHKKLLNKDWKHVEERFQKKTQLLEGKDVISRREACSNQFCFK